MPTRSDPVSPSEPPNPINLKPYVWAIALAWSLLIGILFVTDVLEMQSHIRDLAKTEARATLNKDLAYRRWAAFHGGVYVPVTEATPPNPYLANIPERDITTPSGRALTLMNPAYMTRQVHEMATDLYGQRGHITSLNPIRPENAPDGWEALALQSFARGETEYSGTVPLDDKPHLRVMHALIAEKGCLRCHAAQGYKEGEVRGGISVSIPLDAYLLAERAHIISMVIGYGILWALGLLGLGFSVQRLRRHISERDRAEQALQAQRNALSTLFDNAPGLLLLVDREARVQRANRSTAALAERPADELTGLLSGEVFRCLNAEGAQCGKGVHCKECPVRQRVAKTFQTRERIVNEEGSLSIRAGGREEQRHFLISTTPIRLDNDDSVLVAINDITERKLLEQKLASNVSYLKAIVAAEPECVKIVSPEGALLEMNPAGLKMIEAESLAQAQSRGLLSFVVPEHQPAFSELHERVIQGNSAVLEFETIGLKGGRRWLETHAVPLRDPSTGRTNLLGVTRDITERKRAEKTSREAQAFREAIERSVPAGIAVVDSEGKQTYVNPSFCEMVGWDVENLVGAMPPYAYWPPEERDAIGHAFELTLQGKAPADGFVLRFQRKSGERFDVQVILSGIKDDGSGFTGWLASISDITDRKRADKALRESESSLRQAQVIAGLGSYRLNISTGAWRSSEVLDAIFGIDEAYERSVEGWAALIHPDDRAMMLAYLTNEVLGQSQTFDKEYRIVRHDNHAERWVHGLGELASDVRGRPVSMCGTIQDITERRRMTDALERASHEWRTTFDAVNSAICVLDGDRRIRRCNRAAARLGGLEPQQMMGRYWHNMLPGAGVSQTFARVQQSGHREVDALALRDRWFEVVSDPILDESGAVRGAVHILNDITERKRAEDALRESELRWQFALEGAGDGVWDWNVATKRVFYSRKWKTMLGYDEIEIGDSLNEWDTLVHPHDRDAAHAAIHRHFSGETSAFACEHRLRCKNGSYKWILARGIIISRTPDGAPLRMIGTHADMTERKRDEQALRESEERYRIVSDYSQDWVFWRRPDGSFAFVSPSCAGLTGHTAAEFQRDPKLTQRIIFAEDQPIFDRHLAAVDAQDAHGDLEFRIVRADGAVRWIHHVCQPMFDEQGIYLGQRGSNRDITERKKAEDALAHSHDLMRYIIEHNRSAIAVHDRDMRYIYVSQRYLQDYKVEEKDVIGRHHYELFPDLPQKWKDVHQRVLRGEVLSAEDDAYVRADGSVEWTQWECRPWHEADGSIGGLIVYTEVITNRKKAEDALRESETRFRTLVEQAGDGFELLDEDGRYIDVNRMSCEQLGYSRQELLNLSVFDVDPQLSPKQYTATFRLLTDGPPVTFESVHKRKDGTTFPVEIRASVTRIAGVWRSLALVRDISERKRAEEKVRESEERYRLIVETSSEAILAINADEKLIWVNKTLAESLGYTTDELLGLPLETFIFSEDLDDHEARMQEGGVGKGARYERRLKHKDGSARWMIVSATPVPSKDGGIAGAFAMLTDITKRKRAEEALEAQRNTLSTLFENAPGLLLLVDRDVQVRRANRAVSEMVTTPSRPLLASLAGEVFRCLNAADGQCGKGPACSKCLIRSSVKQAFESHQRVTNREGSLTVGTGERQEERHLLVSAVPLRIDAEELVLLAITDISERKRMENAMRDYNARLRSLTAQLALAEEAERRRLAAVLHDDIGQDLAYCNMQLGSLESQTKGAPFENALQDLGKVVRGVMQRTRSLTFEISPPILYDLGLSAALSALCESTKQKYNLTATFDAQDDGSDIEPNIRVLLYQSVRELVHNVVKHARANLIKIELKKAEEYTVLVVSDDGRGITSDGSPGGFGLFSLRERLSHVGGTLHIRSMSGQGTVATIKVPSF
ncbi:MAG TPA: PAS domain S-box protein [Planctomycetota bacterium]|jgi:PAS domain S-box-containing protein